MKIEITIITPEGERRAKFELPDDFLTPEPEASNPLPRLTDAIAAVCLGLAL